MVRKAPGVIIVRHRLGYVTANAGIDQSNVDHSNGEYALLLPEDPDLSALISAANNNRYMLLISLLFFRAFITSMNMTQENSAQSAPRQGFNLCFAVAKVLTGTRPHGAPCRSGCSGNFNSSAFSGYCSMVMLPGLSEDVPSKNLFMDYVQIILFDNKI